MTMKWCICNGQGTCYGCMIEQTLLKEFGTQGTAFVRARLAAEMAPAAWPIKGVRVEGDKVIVAVKGGNDAARRLCGEILSMLTPDAQRRETPNGEGVGRAP